MLAIAAGGSQSGGELIQPLVLAEQTRQGATGLSPEERFANHKAGHKSNWYAHTYGDALLPELFQHLNPMTYQRALATEITMAEELRHEGFAVWQN